MFKRLFASRNRPCFANPSRWDTLVYDLSGNRLELTLPPQDYDFAEEDNGKRFNLFDPSLYRYNAEPDRNGNPAHCKGVTVPGILRRNWDSYGAIWRSSPLGKLQCAAVVCDIARMSAQLNCFNPEQMERLIIHGMYYSSGPGFGMSEYNTPVNWQVKQLHNVAWIYYETWNRQAEWKATGSYSHGSHFSACLVTPLFNDKYLLISFSAVGFLPAEPSSRIMHERIAQIIPHIKLTLSPEAQQQVEARQLFPDSTYSPTREPEAWKYYGTHRKGDYAKGEKFNVFEGSCSPPPPLY